MTEHKPPLQENPRGVLEQHITNLQSDSKMTRKHALVKINETIFESPENSNCDLTVVFPEIYAYILKCYSDSSEACRETANLIIHNFVQHLPLNDYYLTYILPVLVRRVGCPEIIEESEEIRLLLIRLVHSILDKYQISHLLSPFINDFTSILAKTVTDPYPKVKLEACECIILLTKLIPREFQFQSETYVKPVLSNFVHQHFRVRVAAIKAIGSIVLAGNTKCFELSITPIAEKLFDDNANVRAEVTEVVGNWMLTYRDRYSFWHRMIPLILTSLSDVMEDTRSRAAQLWDDIGRQYMDENEEDLKKKTDFLKDAPEHYPPDVKRPNLGCRTLVQQNIGKIAPAIVKEMEGWQPDCRLRVAQLLCWLQLCAEDGYAQHAQVVMRALHRGAGDDDERVLVEIRRAAELYGYFVCPATWWPLLEAEADSWSALAALAAVLRGSRAALVAGACLAGICKELGDPERCQMRKPKYQTNLMRVVDSLLDLCGAELGDHAETLFIISFTVYAMPVDQHIQFMAFGNLDKLRYVLKTGKSLISLYERYLHRVLSSITSPAVSWTLATPDRCLLECVLANCGYAMGTQLHQLAPLLKDCLTTAKVDPEVKLKTFTTLAAALLRRDNFSKSRPEHLRAFLKVILEEVLVPNLVWSPGRTAEAVRSAAAACLCAALQPDQSTHQLVEKTDGDKATPLDLFPSKEDLEQFLDELIPLLTGLVEDNSELTRQHALRAVCCVTALAKQRECFTAERLHKIYFAVLKRLDDASDEVRSRAAATLARLFGARPADYDRAVFAAHVDALYSALLVHLDDVDEGFRKEMLDVLLSLTDVDPVLLEKKIKANIHLYRNKAAYERLASHIETLKI